MTPRRDAPDRRTSCPSCCSPRSTTCARAAASRSRCAVTSRRSASSAWSQRAIGVAGIGCYTSFSMTMDVDLVQALHGRAPSVATGVKRMLPDAHRVHAPGRRRHGERRAPGGAPHRGARRERHVHPAEQRRVRRDRRPHDRDDACIGQRTKNIARRPRRRVPRLPDPDRRPHRPARRARRTSRAARCTTPVRSPARSDVQARVRGPGPRRGLLVRRGAHDVPDRLVHPDRSRAPTT